MKNPLQFILKRELSVESIVLAVSLYASLVFNAAFWKQTAATGIFTGAPGVWTAIVLFVVITALHYFILLLLSNRWSLKVVVPLVLMISAAAAYFTSHYTVYIDGDMIRNVLNTDQKESREVITAGMVGNIIFLGLLPSILIVLLKVKKPPVLRSFLKRLAVLAVTAAVILGAIFSSYQSVSSMMRNHKPLRYLVTPANFLAGTAGVFLKDTRKAPRQTLGKDAVSTRSRGEKPRLIVLVIGETVRTQNWGLNGYARQTTPELAKINPISFADVSSCGTATETSLPCIFTPWGRGDLDLKRIKNSESFLHVLNRAGVQTMWIDNQSGCKGVCADLPFESIQQVTAATDHCTVDAGCYDMELLSRLKAYLPTVGTKDAIVVLHQLGNHGPSYYKRSPPAAKVFLPECVSDELSDCSTQEIINGYDNAIVASDAFLASTIKYLETLTDRDAGMIYICDHGESLGESGLFLHGMPYAIAPKTQTSVPMFMWFSQGFAKDRGINETCLRERAKKPASHDNLFHSVIGLMQVRTAEYVADRDVLKGCESTP